MEEMYFAWLENPQSVHKVGTHPARGVGGQLLGLRGVGRSNLPAVCSRAGFVVFQVLRHPCVKALSSFGEEIRFLPVVEPTSGGWAGLEVPRMPCSATPGPRPAPAPPSGWAVCTGPLVM